MSNAIRAHDRIPATSILVGDDRVRTDFGNLEELAESIKSEGLLQPPVVNQDYKLIAGERRLRAMRDILKWPDIPVIYFETLDEAHLARLESEENIKRLAPNWKERVLSVAKVHNANALAGALNSQRWGQRETAALLGVSQPSVQLSLKLAEYIKSKDADILKADSAKAAIEVLLQRAEDARNKLLVEMTMKKNPQGLDILNVQLGKTVVANVKAKTAEELDAELFGTPAPSGIGGVFQPTVSTSADDGEMPGAAPTPSHVTIDLSSAFVNLDGAHALIKRGPDSIDHVICDLPYGIDMDNLQQDQGGQDISATREGHIIENNIDFWKRLIPSVYDSLRDGGYFIGFYDLEFHNLITDLGRSAGFKVQRWPLVWAKTHRCSNQSANVNFTKSHEVAFVFRKGKATLLQPQDRSVWTGSNEAEAKALGHPFAKPYKLWQWLYAAVAQRGQTVFDPCVGRGSSTIAALEAGLIPHGAELIPADYNALIVNLQSWYRAKDPSVQFV